ncbi:MULTISPECIES: hypothetical protein [Bradyrhizobium]|jgi:hypothetical protein|uniref:hypothetical protein n=1 Tax=Bradyrhizobium TaxID=374 RepID=UPI0022268115|nr:MULTISPECIES: hypothetical protein [Bradyrhizobium]MCW2355273.1 hypothetical protein [Bradyrhizobium elkanii]MDI2057830.1 hypothetical protein [Bradyrhizobium sp. Mp19]WLA99644.1 hypothetical protein QNJ80_40675 [Bradyrhizobium elkanii]
MIDSLRVAKTANFHILKRQMSNAALDDLFRQVRASQPSASQNIFYHRRVQAGRARWSAISFLYDRSPSFLTEDAGIRERICGFILLIEYRDHLAILKSKLDLPAGFFTRYLGRVSAERVDRAVARQGAVFEKIRLRNMSVSKHVMRSKTFEADDLQNVVGPAGANRYVPQAYAVRSGTDHYSTTPSTGRIGQRSDRVDHLALVEYAKSVIDELVGGRAAPASFLRTLARAIDLASIGGTARPTSFAVDVAGFVDAIHVDREIRLVHEDSGRLTQLSKHEIDAALNELDRAFRVSGDGKRMDIFDGADSVGAIAINQARVALRDLQLPITAGIEVESTEYALGHDPNRISLRRYIDREDKFILLFDALSLAYIDGTLFRDEGFVDGGAALLRHLRSDPLLDGVTDEKGNFSTRKATFDADSTFGVIEASVADGDDVLVCDDLGDEWADYIGLNNSSSPPRITFYHAKHGPLSLGAGPFHISVSQAIKNLQRMSLPPESMEAKIRGWDNKYVSGSGVKTRIKRIVRGDADELMNEFAQVRLAPDAIRRVFIVTSSLSRGAVEEALKEVAAGQAPDPYFVQLYWLLMSFFSACTEMNAHGYVICQT